MYIVPNLSQGAETMWMDPVEASRLTHGQPDGDVVEISAEGLQALHEEGTRRLVNQALSLPRIQARIQTVRSEIETVWNSALPDREKLDLVSAKENEIALLQAGQFSLARLGFSKVA